MLRRLAYHLNLVFFNAPFEDIKVFGVKDQHGVVFVDNEDLPLLHVLAEGDSFSHLKGIAFYPLALRSRSSVIVFLYFF